MVGTFSMKVSIFWKLQAMGNGVGDIERDLILERTSCLKWGWDFVF